MDVPPGWDKVSIHEVIGSALISLGVGMIRFLMLIRKARKVTWVDALLEPSLAMFGGMLMWSVSEYSGAPDVLQAALTSIGAWGGPRTIHRLERKIFGGSRETDFTALDEGK